MIATVIATLPRRAESKAGGRADEICLAICLMILFFLKMSFFLGVLGIVFGAALLRSFSLKSLGLAIAYLVGLMIGVELLFNNVGEYLSDLRLAASVYADEGQNGRMPRIMAAAVMGFVVFGLALLMIRLAAKPSNLKGWFGYWWRECALAALIIGGAAAIKSQNHPRWELAMLSLALLIVAVRVTRRREETLRSEQEQGPSIKPSSPRLWSIVSALIVGVTLVPHLASDSISIVYHLVETRKGADCSRPEFRGTPMAPLLFPKPGLLSASSGDAPCADIFASAPGELPQSDEAEYRRLLRTTEVLREHVQPDDVLLALEFANPYSFIFRTAPPRGALIFWDRGRTFSYNIHPDAASVLQDVTFAVQTDYPTQVEALVPSRIEMWTRLRQALRPIYDDGTGTGQDMWFVYGKAVQEAFSPVGHQGEVTIWQRRDNRVR
jgi:hypothetical protein